MTQNKLIAKNYCRIVRDYSMLSCNDVDLIQTASTAKRIEIVLILKWSTGRQLKAILSYLH